MDGCKYRQLNLGRIINCQLYTGTGRWKEKPEAMQIRELTLQINDERNALERVMLHFAHFEKQAERVDDNKYLLHLKYYATDETEIVIRVLSFGPCVKVISPDSFVGLIKERLEEQKRCGVGIHASPRKRGGGTAVEVFRLAVQYSDSPAFTILKLFRAVTVGIVIAQKF